MSQLAPIDPIGHLEVILHSETVPGVHTIETPEGEVNKRMPDSSMDAPERDDDVAVKEPTTPIFANYDGTNNDMAAKRGKKAPVRLNVRSAKRPKTDAWSVESLMQNTKSKLLNINLKELLKDNQAWTFLDKNAQEKIISMFPDARRTEFVTTIADGTHVLNQSALMNNSSWNYFIGCFRDDIELGRNKSAWLQDANTAYMERQAGKYDSWKEKEYEEFWGMKQKLATGVIAGSSASLKWDDLVERGFFKPGDVFQYNRRVSGVLVKKDVELMEIIRNEDTGKTTMRCRFAAGKRILPKGNNEDIISPDIASPESLGKTAININGGLKGQRLPNGNAWKAIRLIRKNQDLGTVWDIRQAAHFQNAENGRKPSAKKLNKTAVSAQNKMEEDEEEEDEDDDDGDSNGKFNDRSKKANTATVVGDDNDDQVYAEAESNGRGKRSRR